MEMINIDNIFSYCAKLNQIIHSTHNYNLILELFQRSGWHLFSEEKRYSPIELFFFVTEDDIKKGRLDGIPHSPGEGLLIRDDQDQIRKIILCVKVEN